MKQDSTVRSSPNWNKTIFLFQYTSFMEFNNHDASKNKHTFEVPDYMINILTFRQDPERKSFGCNNLSPNSFSLSGLFYFILMYPKDVI